MASTSDSWYYITAANFYDNHVRPALIDGRESKEQDIVRQGPQGGPEPPRCGGAATMLNTTIFKTKNATEPLKVLLKKELATAVNTAPAFTAGGDCAVHFTTTETYRIVTVKIDPQNKNKLEWYTLQEGHFNFMIARYAIDNKCRIMHYG